MGIANTVSPVGVQQTSGIGTLDPKLRFLVRLASMSLKDSVEGGIKKEDLRRVTGEKAERFEGFLKTLINLGLVKPPYGDRYNCSVSTLVALKLLGERLPGLAESRFQERTYEQIVRALTPVTTRDEIRGGSSTQVFVARVPGSILLAGEHEVLRGSATVVLPIPLFVRAGIAITWDKHNDGGFNEVYYYGETRNEQPFYSLKEAEIELGRVPLRHDPYFQRIRDSFVTKLKLRLQTRFVRIKELRVALQTEIPPSCGLGSSAAFSAVFALLLSAVTRASPPKIRGWGNSGFSRLSQDRSFRKVFIDASTFEEELFGVPTSGAACFASLVGSVNNTPFLYEATRRRGKPRLLRYEKFPSRFLDAWRKDFGISAIYSREPRPPAVTGKSSFFDALKKEQFVRELSTVTEKLWEELTKEKDGPHGSHAITCVQVQGSYESGFLGAMQSAGEADLRRLCAFLSEAGLGAKYCGAGKGGDILVFGRPIEMRNALFPNHFPVHFSSMLSGSTPATVDVSEVHVPH